MKWRGPVYPRRLQCWSEIPLSFGFSCMAVELNGIQLLLPALNISMGS